MAGRFRPIYGLAGAGNAPIANAALDWTPSDVETLPLTTLAIRVEVAGHVTVRMWGDSETDVTIRTVPAGGTIYGNFSAIRATGTAASGFTVFYML